MTKIIKLTVVIVIGYLLINIMPIRCTGTEQYNYTMEKLEIVGHRGAAGLAPENSLLAIELGITNNASIIEIDVHLTKDQEVIVCHDKTVQRTTNGKGRIKNMTLSQLKELKLVDKNGIETSQTMPTLTEVINLVGDKAKLLIEIKDGYKEGVTQKVIDIIAATNSEDMVIIQSFSDNILTDTHRLNPNLRLEKLYILKLLGLPIIIDNGISILSAKKYKHITSLNSYYKYLTPNQAKQIREMGKEIRLYTVDDPEEISDSVKQYVNSIITDRPDMWK